MDLRSRLRALERAGSSLPLGLACSECGSSGNPDGPRLILFGTGDATRCETCGSWRTADGRTSTRAIFLVGTPGEPPAMPEGVQEIERLRAKAEDEAQIHRVLEMNDGQPELPPSRA